MLTKQLSYLDIHGRIHWQSAFLYVPLPRPISEIFRSENSGIKPSVYVVSLVHFVRKNVGYKACLKGALHTPELLVSSNIINTSKVSVNVGLSLQYSQALVI